MPHHIHAKRRLGLDDPQDEAIEEIRVIRDEIEEKTIPLLARMQ